MISAHGVIRETGEGEWIACRECEGIRVGMVAQPRCVEIRPDPALRTIAEALEAQVDGDVSGGLSLAEICPDPLTFALESGLPRPSLLDRRLDGQSEWSETAPVADRELTAVSIFAEHAAGVLSDGQRASRVVFETRFYRMNGAPVGTARAICLCREEKVQ